MRLVVRIAAADDAKAWAILQRHSPGVALPKRTFVISDAAARALRQAGIRFSELSREGQVAGAQRVVAGERV